MTLHKLSAGSGYEYLTRQVAAMDSTEKGHATLASYYSETGESPGVWVGSGMVGIEGLKAGDVVTAEQMRNLFGSGHHPLADERLAALPLDAADKQVNAVVRLGAPYKIFKNEGADFNIEVARRVEALNVAAGRPSKADAGIEVRAQVRSELAREFFAREHGREPSSARELASALARYSRPKRQAVAGFDLTFSPVKSVSTLWAVAPLDVAAVIEKAHQAAVRDALAFIEREALFTREGLNGARQVETCGLVATAFTHRDSRAGDPDLHTHVAVANKVQTLDGKWLSIYGRLLYKAAVAASETYNTALELHLTETLGVQFGERPSAARDKRPIREIVGVDADLNSHWSSRRMDIEARRRVLVREFQGTHGRPPTPVEAIALAQQANLETRQKKHEPRSLVDQRETWRAEAIDALGSEQAIGAMVRDALNPSPVVPERVSAAWVKTTAECVIGQVETHRATWQVWHLRAEAQRQIRGAAIRADRVADVVQWVVDDALGRLSVCLTLDTDPITEPEALRRSDGASVYSSPGAEIFTSQRILDAEQRIVAAAGIADGRRVPSKIIDLAVLESATNGVTLNAGQVELVRAMATSGVSVQLAIAAAGSGKTTAMSVLARAWAESGGNIIGLAPSAAAAATLRAETGAACETLAKLTYDLSANPGSDLVSSIGAGTLLLIDEAGMADTLTLETVISYAVSRGASVRLIGDDQQLAAIGAGGVLRDIQSTHGALRLDELMRFSDPAEASATLAMREGYPSALGFYLDHDRVHVGDLTTSADAVFEAWSVDRRQGLDSVMLAPTRELVTELNLRARTARLAASGEPTGAGVTLTDGSHASVGDRVITRLNNRRLGISATDWVKNGDRWHITAINDGALSVRHAGSRLHVTLPADYVAAHVELGYASTIHTAQGLSVDSMHGIVTGEESRQLLYTMLTRGRHANHVYLAVTGDGDPHQLVIPETNSPATATEILEGILARDGSAVSASSTRRVDAAPEPQLHQAATRYGDAVLAGAEQLIGQHSIDELENAAEHIVPGMTDSPAWPALRASLLLIEADGRNARDELSVALAVRNLDDAADPAAVLAWRLAPEPPAQTGPVPWLSSIPRNLAADPEWGPYLAARADRVEGLAVQVRIQIDTEQLPKWARPLQAQLSKELSGELAVWRAAVGVDPSDRRPAGPPLAQGNAAQAYQQSLIRRINDGTSPALTEWGARIDRHIRCRDDFTPELADRLAGLQRQGIDANRLLTAAASGGPLPDDHASSALWFRILDQLGPAQRPRRANTNELKPLAPRHEPPHRKPPASSLGI